MSTPVTWQDALQQATFHKDVHGWICAIADVLDNDEKLYLFLKKLPPAMRRNMYNILKPRLSFTPKPFFVYKLI